MRNAIPFEQPHHSQEADTVNGVLGWMKYEALTYLSYYCQKRTALQHDWDFPFSTIRE